MTKNEFLLRFQLHHLSTSRSVIHSPKKLKPAAVLIPLIESPTQINNVNSDYNDERSHENSLHLLLTKRASHLKHHAGQVSFPGGKVEPSDRDIFDTAMRETQEEIGISYDNITIIGQLQPQQTNSGFIVTPIIGFVSSKPPYMFDKNEVAEVFQVPLRHFLNTDNHFSSTRHRHGQQYKVHFMPYQHYNIWGATAAILKDLVLHLN